MRLLITGGAGFVGSSIAFQLKEKYPKAQVAVFDNLKRRGSEFNLRRFREHGIKFVHGDVRSLSDLMDLGGKFDLVIDASAEPSVHTGMDGSPNYPVQTNLWGTFNCLEFVNKCAGGLIFLSTSRVYSMRPLQELKLKSEIARYELNGKQQWPGVTEKGISETFPTHLPRSIYGATKLASEMLIQEYVEAYGMRAIMNRCGVIAGPGQFGKVDQGVFTLWVAHHYFKQGLKYIGYGGQGVQVRDLLHPTDLFELLEKQWEDLDAKKGSIFNVGGGREISASLKEYTELCQRVTGNSVSIKSVAETTAVDVPWYVSDYSNVSREFDWRPSRSVLTIIEAIYSWIRDNEAELRPLFV